MSFFPGTRLRAHGLMGLALTLALLGASLGMLRPAGLSMNMNGNGNGLLNGLAGSSGPSAPVVENGSCEGTACGCPADAPRALCCCSGDASEESDGESSPSPLALLIGGLGCQPTAPQALTASPAGPIAPTVSVVSVPAFDSDARPHADVRLLVRRPVRPPVPPPRS